MFTLALLPLSCFFFIHCQPVSLSQINVKASSVKCLVELDVIGRDAEPKRYIQQTLKETL